MSEFGKLMDDLETELRSVSTAYGGKVDTSTVRSAEIIQFNAPRNETPAIETHAPTIEGSAIEAEVDDEDRGLGDVIQFDIELDDDDDLY